MISIIVTTTATGKPYHACVLNLLYILFHKPTLVKQIDQKVSLFLVQCKIHVFILRTKMVIYNHLHPQHTMQQNKALELLYTETMQVQV